jgi:hypothetical protein
MVGFSLQFLKVFFSKEYWRRLFFPYKVVEESPEQVVKRLKNLCLDFRDDIYNIADILIKEINIRKQLNDAIEIMYLGMFLVSIILNIKYRNV